MMLKWRLDRGITSQINMLKKGFSEVCTCTFVVHVHVHVYTYMYIVPIHCTAGSIMDAAWYSFACLYTNPYVGQCGI